MAKIALCFSVADDDHSLKDIEALHLIFYQSQSCEIVSMQKIALLPTLSKFLVMGFLQKTSIGEWEYVYETSTLPSVIEYVETVS